jgi:hypothetical protein
MIEKPMQSRFLVVATALCVVLGPYVARLRALDEPVGPSQAIGEKPVRISFLHDVIPTLTKAGCNSGTCHGTPSGKNGFRLSLRGFDADLDAQTLVRESQGRRVNRLDPDQSLLLLKAAAEVPHQGGRRFRKESVPYRILRDWIAQGALDDRASAPLVERLELTPSQALLEGADATATLVVTAHFRGGSSRDVTHLTRFGVDDETSPTARSTTCRRASRARCATSRRP